MKQFERDMMSRSRLVWWVAKHDYFLRPMSIKHEIVRHTTARNVRSSYLDIDNMHVQRRFVANHLLDQSKFLWFP